MQMQMSMEIKRRPLQMPGTLVLKQAPLPYWSSPVLKTEDNDDNDHGNGDGDCDDGVGGDWDWMVCFLPLSAPPS